MRDSFTFSHRFWCDSQLIRDITIEGTFKTLPHIPAEAAQSSSEGGAAVDRRYKANESGLMNEDGDAQLQNQNKDGDGFVGASECRVVLHWPPAGHLPDLKQHNFNITYSHLFLVRGDSIPPFAQPHFTLVSKHSATFIEEV